MMLTEDDIIDRLRCSYDTMHILSADEANEMAAVFEELRKERDEWRGIAVDAERKVEKLREVLEFYADEGTYHACAFLFDRPTGGFDEDFDQHPDSEYDRPMPGKRARTALAETEKTNGD